MPQKRCVLAIFELLAWTDFKRINWRLHRKFDRQQRRNKYTKWIARDRVTCDSQPAIVAVRLHHEYVPGRICWHR